MWYHIYVVIPKPATEREVSQKRILTDSYANDKMKIEKVQPKQAVRLISGYIKLAT